MRILLGRDFTYFKKNHENSKNDKLFCLENISVNRDLTFQVLSVS